jgi:hypothetical protein
MTGGHRIRAFCPGLARYIERDYVLSQMRHPHIFISGFK